MNWLQSQTDSIDASTLLVHNQVATIHSLNIRNKSKDDMWFTIGQGTGLGLSLAYDIIKLHGGEIEVESRGSEESEFIIHLPV